MRRALILASASIVLVAGPTTSSAQFPIPRVQLPVAVIQRIESATTTKQIADVIKTLSPTAQATVIKSFQLDPRIIGGFGIDIAQVPWQVALIRGYAPEPMRSQFCGGTLIAPDIILTAAHCVDNSIVRNDASRLHIVAGTAFYPAGGDRVSVAAINVHPKWDRSTMDYDFAILKLARPVTAGSPVPIQTVPAVAGITGRVSGWGARAEGGDGTVDLLAADIPVVDRGVCNTNYGGAITAEMICAGLNDGGLDSCQGDSGGPFVAGLPSTPRLMGVVSWGEGCGRKLRYGVYADVSQATTWIRSFSTQIAVASTDSSSRMASAR